MYPLSKRLINDLSIAKQLLYTHVLKNNKNLYFFKTNKMSIQF